MHTLLCCRRDLPFGTILGSLSDLFGLRLPLPLQSRPAQISDGTQDGTEQLELCYGYIALVSRRPTGMRAEGETAGETVRDWGPHQQPKEQVLGVRC